MARVRRDANARLLLRLCRILSALLQIRIVKPTLGRPVYRFDLGDTWIITTEEGMRPNLNETAICGDRRSSLPDSQHLPDEMP